MLFIFLFKYLTLGSVFLENLYIPEAPGLGHSLGVADDEVGVLVFLGQSHGHRA